MAPEENRLTWYQRTVLVPVSAIWSMVLIASACLVAMVVFGVVTNRTANHAKESTEAIIQQRTESRVRLCEKDKRFAQAHNRLVIAIATDAGSHAIAPDVQAAVDANTVTVPDCSPAGIAAFYAGKK